MDSFAGLPLSAPEAVGFDATRLSRVGDAMRGAVERLETMQTELDWRRDQMLEARQLAARKPLSSLLGPASG